MGLAKAAQSWSSRFMRKGGFTGGYVIYDNFLTAEQQAQVLEKFPKIRDGDVEDIGKMGLLQGGPKIVPAGITQKDSQFIESQQFQEEALAGIWGVPLYLANRAGKTSIMGSNLEQQTSGFITFGLSPYIKAIEDEINDKLFGGTTQFVEFVVEGILREQKMSEAFENWIDKALAQATIKVAKELAPDLLARPVPKADMQGSGISARQKAPGDMEDEKASVPGRDDTYEGDIPDGAPDPKANGLQEGPKAPENSPAGKAAGNQQRKRDASGSERRR